MLELLPIKDPATHEESAEFFYTNIIKPLTNTFLRLMDTGLPIDQKAISVLKDVISESISKAETEINMSEPVQRYLKSKNKYIEKTLEEENTRDVEYYYKPYAYRNIPMRTKLMNRLTKKLLNSPPKEKWLNRDVKLFLKTYPDYRNDIRNPESALARSTAVLFAEEKLEIYNKSLATKVSKNQLHSFNCGSTVQIRELFSLYGLESSKKSAKTQNDSWDKEALKALLNTLPEGHEFIPIVKNFQEIGEGSIILTTFIPAIQKFSINNVLYGNLKLFGAKTFRPTSQAPNLLNMPSNSKHSKVFKKAFIPPKNRLVWTIDFAALEDRVIANLSKDANKIAIFTEGLDGHSLAATYYFKKDVEKLIGKFTDHKEAAKKLKALVDNGDEKADKIRKRGKPITFGLSYGAYPRKVATTIGCSIEEATAIFNAYHEKMFPDIRKMIDNTLETAQEQGYIHLGLGCRIYTDDPQKDIRTLFNARNQFWSILTLMSLHDLYDAVDTRGYSRSIYANATIYDSLYGHVTPIPKVIKFLNDTIVSFMKTDFIENQEVHNDAELEIGTSWGEVTKIPHNATENQIKEIINEITT